MKIKNIGSKVVGIGPHILMPGDEIAAGMYENEPAVKALVEMGYLEMAKGEPEVKPVAEEKAAEEPPKEEKHAPVKRSRRSAKAKAE